VLAPILFCHIYRLHKVIFHVQLWVGVSSRGKMEYPKLLGTKSSSRPAGTAELLYRPHPPIGQNLPVWLHISCIPPAASQKPAGQCWPRHTILASAAGTDDYW